jgi:DNA modification methylase
MIINGDALAVLKRMKSKSIHCAVTSSPYYGLRNYGTEPQIWDGDPNCQHEWGTVHPPGYRSSDTNPVLFNMKGINIGKNLKSKICLKCGAWKGELGQEATPDDFIRHLTIDFHELKRVLRDDGIFWVNIGDSYARNPAKGGSGTPTGRNNRGENYTGAGMGNDLKEKDLIGIPWMLAFSMRSDGAASPQTMLAVEKIRDALLSDYDIWTEVPQHTRSTIEELDSEWEKAHNGGWYLRADLPWLKRNSLPSSVTDRPSSSIEHVFLFSKSGDTQFWTHPELPGTRIQPTPDYRWKDKNTNLVLSEEPYEWKTQIHLDIDGNIVYKNGKPELRYKRFNLWDGHDYFYDHIATMQPSSESYSELMAPHPKGWGFQ